MHFNQLLPVALILTGPATILPALHEEHRIADAATIDAGHAAAPACPGAAVHDTAPGPTEIDYKPNPYWAARRWRHAPYLAVPIPVLH